MLTAELDVSPQRDLNLCSAFAHVLADTLRTFTVMACALLVSVGGFDASATDAVGSLVVCAVIAVVAAYVTYEACSQALALRADRRTAAAAEALPVEAAAPTLEGDTAMPRRSLQESLETAEAVGLSCGSTPVPSDPGGGGSLEAPTS